MTRYVDGDMSPEEAAAFETKHPEAAAQKLTDSCIGNLLRKHSEIPPLQHAEFFNHQILREITSTSSPSSPHYNPPPLLRFAFAGTACLLAAAGIYFGFVASQEKEPEFAVQITEIKAGDDQLSVKLIESEGLAVVWVDGLDYLPDTYTLE